MIVSDNGTELASNAIVQSADDHKVTWHCIAPGGAERFCRIACAELRDCVSRRAFQGAGFMGIAWILYKLGLFRKKPHVPPHYRAQPPFHVLHWNCRGCPFAGHRIVGLQWTNHRPKKQPTR